jgi:sugar transferase EpsL
MTDSHRVIKRTIDIAGAFIGLVMLSPIFCCIAIGVFATMGCPILFRQIRPGLRGEPFGILKFRTMKNHHDIRGRPLPDADRITRVGRLLRSASLDEIPELINVIKGEMSLVGPRPFLMQYLDQYTPEQMRRHEVKPGITGWAQVNGRNAITWQQKFAFDVWYVDHQSLLLDFRIVVMTIWKVLTCQGISQPGRVTMEEFQGIAPRGETKGGS